MRVPSRPPVRSGPTNAHTHPSEAPVTELDVRDDLRNRREPFSRIMAAVESLPEDGVLHLRATFEPVPLLTLLGRQGFVFESLEHEPDDWSVWFWRQAAGDDSSGRTTSVASDAAPASIAKGGSVPATGSAPTAGRASATPAPSDDSSGDVQLDVRGLEPPEPMVRTLAALEGLAPGRTLVQVNVRAPQFLLPILAERGFTYEIDESAADRVLVRIRRGG